MARQRDISQSVAELLSGEEFGVHLPVAFSLQMLQAFANQHSDRMQFCGLESFLPGLVLLVLLVVPHQVDRFMTPHMSPRILLPVKSMP